MILINNYKFKKDIYRKKVGFLDKWIVGIIFLLLLFIVGCAKDKDLPDNPPKMFIKIGEKSYETILGTYCWSNGSGKGICVDKAGPEDLLEGKKPISVKQDEKIHIVMKDPKPNETHLLIVNGNIEKEVKIIENQFSVPKEKGIYYYSFGTWWKDNNDENVSNGDAYYAFAIEVE